jgi:hypothetical protein
MHEIIVQFVKAPSPEFSFKALQNRRRQQPQESVRLRGRLVIEAGTIPLEHARLLECECRLPRVLSSGVSDPDALIARTGGRETDHQP